MKTKYMAIFALLSSVSFGMNNNLDNMKYENQILYGEFTARVRPGETGDEQQDVKPSAEPTTLGYLKTLGFDFYNDVYNTVQHPINGIASFIGGIGTSLQEVSKSFKTFSTKQETDDIQLRTYERFSKNIGTSVEHLFNACGALVVDSAWNGIAKTGFYLVKDPIFLVGHTLYNSYNFGVSSINSIWNGACNAYNFSVNSIKSALDFYKNHKIVLNTIIITSAAFGGACYVYGLPATTEAILNGMIYAKNTIYSWGKYLSGVLSSAYSAVKTAYYEKTITVCF